MDTDTLNQLFAFHKIMCKYDLKFKVDKVGHPQPIIWKKLPGESLFHQQKRAAMWEFTYRKFS